MLLVAGGSERKGSPYANKTQALAKMEPFLWLDHAPVPLPVQKTLLKGKWGTVCALRAPLPSSQPRGTPL